MPTEKTLFSDEEVFDSQEHWIDMPEYVQDKKSEYQKITIRFDCKKDVEEFEKLIGQKLTEKTKSIWFPKLDRYKNKGVYYGD